MLLAAALFGAAVAAESPQAELRLRDQDGHEQSLSDYRGKVVVLNFWATWCLPCRDEMPLLVEARKRYGERIEVIAVSIDANDTRGKVPGFVSKHKLNFPVWLGAGPDDMRKLGMGEAVPATAFIDAEGRTAGRVLGQLKKRDLFPRLEWMLGNHAGKEPPPLVNNLK